MCFNTLSSYTQTQQAISQVSEILSLLKLQNLCTLFLFLGPSIGLNILISQVV